MSRIKNYLEQSSEQLVIDFQEYLSSKSIDHEEVTFEDALTIVIHRGPPADSIWDDEWQWVKSWFEKNMGGINHA